MAVAMVSGAMPRQAALFRITSKPASVIGCEAAADDGRYAVGAQIFNRAGGKRIL